MTDGQYGTRQLSRVLRKAKEAMIVIQIRVVAMFAGYRPNGGQRIVTTASCTYQGLKDRIEPVIFEGYHYLGI